MAATDLIHWIFVALGLFTFAEGLFGWEWVMSSAQARFFSKALGRTGTRIFYMVLGLGFVALGVLRISEIIETTAR